MDGRGNKRREKGGESGGKKITDWRERRDPKEEETRVKNKIEAVNIGEDEKKEERVCVWGSAGDGLRPKKKTSD